MTTNLKYDLLAKYPSLNGVTVLFMSVKHQGQWLDVYNGGDKNHFPKLTSNSEDTVMEHQFFLSGQL